MFLSFYPTGTGRVTCVPVAGDRERGSKDDQTKRPNQLEIQSGKERSRHTNDRVSGRRTFGVTTPSRRGEVPKVISGSSGPGPEPGEPKVRWVGETEDGVTEE